MKKTTTTLSSLALLSAGAAYGQYSPYLPAKEQIVASPSFVYSTYDEFWVGDNKVTTKQAGLGSRQNQYYAGVGLEYGVIENLAVDATIGWVWSEFVDPPPGSPSLKDDGLYDTAIGVRYRIVDEFKSDSKWMPTLGVRLGGIIAGTYSAAPTAANPAGFPFAPGDGASGVETSLLFGKQICSGFGLAGDFGWRYRTDDVPQDIFGSFGAYANIDWFIASAAYRGSYALSGPNIGDPGFTFPEVQEINHLVEVSVGYVAKTGQSIQIFGAKSIAGQNTGDKWVGGVSVSLPFGGK